MVSFLVRFACRRRILCRLAFARLVTHRFDLVVRLVSRCVLHRVRCRHAIPADSCRDLIFSPTKHPEKEAKKPPGPITRNGAKSWPIYKAAIRNINRSPSRTARQQFLPPAMGIQGSDRYSFDPATGKITESQLYDDLPRSAQIRGWIYSVHAGTWGGMTTRILSCLVSLLGAVFALTGYYFWIKKKLGKLNRPSCKTDRTTGRKKGLG